VLTINSLLVISAKGCSGRTSLVLFRSKG